MVQKYSAKKKLWGSLQKVKGDETAFQLHVHISKTLKIEGKPTQIPSQNFKISNP
jgi:hypothetical protein